MPNSRILLIALALCIPVVASEPVTLDEGLRSLYNFDFPAAHSTFNQFIEAHPQDPLPYAFRGAAYLFTELDRLGALESEFLTDDERLVEKTKPQPDPNIRKLLMQAISDAEKRADVALKANPNDKDALFAMVAISGVSTDYMALVEKRQMSSLSPAKKSNAFAQRLLKLDPTFYDAYLTAGFSEYMIGSMPFFVRWFVHFDNVEGSKQRGIHNLEMVARDGRYLKPLAKIYLGIISLREKRPAEARRLLTELVHDYPRNPLYRKELQKLSARAD